MLTREGKESMAEKQGGRSVYVVGGSRTPFLKAQGVGGLSASDLAVHTARHIFAPLNLRPSDLSQVITGCVMPSAREANIARIIGLRLGMDVGIPAWTVQRNCASGLQALDSACMAISMGQDDLILAGGTEAMSRAPLLYSQAMGQWFATWMQARTLSRRLRHLLRLRFRNFAPEIALLQGLTDHTIGLSMGQTAENLAYKFGIHRDGMDAFALRSHARAIAARDLGYDQDEMAMLFDSRGQVYDQDTGIRHDCSRAKLAKLKPMFDRYGLVSAGNSSQITDGAAMVLLASADAVRTYRLPVLAKLSNAAWSGVDPAHMGLGPVHSIAALLKRQRQSFSGIDLWEINEAFAVQVLACQQALADKHYCREHLGTRQAVGEIAEDCLNIEGGAIALGHPVGASGARLVWHMVQLLQRNQAKRGIVSLCIGGGQGGAMMVTRTNAVER
jgi:acetyl-CoA C-acetyltransferase